MNTIPRFSPEFCPEVQGHGHDFFSKCLSVNSDCFNGTFKKALRAMMGASKVLVEVLVCIIETDLLINFLYKQNIGHFDSWLDSCDMVCGETVAWTDGKLPAKSCGDRIIFSRFGFFRK